MSVSDPVRTQILDAAQQLLADDPAHDVTMAQVAARSGLSRSTLYRRVGNKEVLLRCLARERGFDVETPDGDDIPARILQAARVVFGQHGLARSTMEQIAAEAGLGVATLYRHFGNRQNLIRAFLRRHAPRSAFRQGMPESSGDLEADLTHLVTELLIFMHHNRDIIWLSLVAGPDTERLLAGLREGPAATRRQMVDFFEAAIAADQVQDRDPRQLTTALVGMLVAFGLEMPVFGGPPLEDPTATARFIVDVLLNGLRADSAVKE
jgi:AcrR family transcriptional regulator